MNNDLISSNVPAHDPPEPSSAALVTDGSLDATTVFASNHSPIASRLRQQIAESCQAWLARSTSLDTRTNYARDLGQFLSFVGVPDGRWEDLALIRPAQIAAWRDALLGKGLTNRSVSRKLTVVRSLYSYLSAYGFTGANPAHSKFVASPPVPRDGRTLGLSPEDCRRFLDVALDDTPQGARDRALIAVLAYTGCRVGELCRLRIMDYKASAGHRVLEIRGKGGKERRVPVHPEAFERLDRWIALAGIRDEAAGPLFRPPVTARGRGFDGFRSTALTRRAVQYLVARYVVRLGLDPHVTVHSFRVTALTTARERGADIVDLQDLAGHSDPRTTLAYIRNRDRLSKSPVYVLRY